MEQFVNALTRTNLGPVEHLGGLHGTTTAAPCHTQCAQSKYLEGHHIRQVCALKVSIELGMAATCVRNQFLC